MPHECLLCNNAVANRARRDENYWRITCPDCGSFDCRVFEALQLAQLPQLDRLRVACLFRENKERRPDHEFESPELSIESFNAYLSITPRYTDVAMRGRKLLQAVERRTVKLGTQVRLRFDDDCPLGYCAKGDKDGLLYIINYLITQKLLTSTNNLEWVRVEITPKGWEELQRLPRIESDKAFVAMWFNAEVENAFPDAIKPAIENCGYRAIKIDMEEFNEGIVDQVIAEINESRFIVADLTDHRNGVYFEAGYAKGIGLEVIWTCREDHARDTHFDARHLNQIRWTTTEELREKLTNRIRATIGKGPLLPQEN
jgi:nucleoside 2-deoxyribosyltransferase